MDIDIVIPWVDSADPSWQEEFNRYAPEAKQFSGSDIRKERFEDFGYLRYLFRSIEKYAPWVRKVHFVTCGQKPDWLNLENPKLHWVKHTDYIPNEYLPVFSSHCIELYFNKIPDLAEHFVYMNDDFYFVSPVKESYYFKKGLPCDYGYFNVLGAKTSRIPHIVLNNLIQLNKNFDKKKLVKKNFGKWFSPLYGNKRVGTLCSLPWNSIDGIANRHHAQPYLKSSFEEVWTNCEPVLTHTMQHRFRNVYEDVNQWLIRGWQLCKGNFIPSNSFKYEKMLKLTHITDSEVSAVLNHKYYEICIDDNTDDETCEDINEKIKKVQMMFETLFPEKSSFEV